MGADVTLARLGPLSTRFPQVAPTTEQLLNPRAKSAPASDRFPAKAVREHRYRACGPAVRAAVRLVGRAVTAQEAAPEDARAVVGAVAWPTSNEHGSCGLPNRPSLL